MSQFEKMSSKGVYPMQKPVNQTHDDFGTDKGLSLASLYRTRWLMAHNRLHATVHDPKASLTDSWNEYLKELESSEDVAKMPA